MHLVEACDGCVWRRTFLEESYEVQVPTSAGVYLICASARILLGRGAAGLYNAVYVGQARDLRRRFREHLRGYGNVPKARMTFRRLDYWYISASPSDLDRIEQAFLDALGPSANDRNVRARIGEGVPAGAIGRFKERG